MDINVTLDNEISVVIGLSGSDGRGIIAGGTTGQVLSKVDDTDYNMGWSDAGSGDMSKLVYDPSDISGNAFNQDNMVNGLINFNYTGTERTKLSGIDDGAEVNNISNVNATDLTDLGASSLHYHTSDRARANHTGTQTANTISDFDTEVSNNTDVDANTTSRHDAVTVTDTTEIDLTLVGQDIKADLKTTSVVAGSYSLSNITVDSKGRITDASSGSPSGTPLTTKGDLLTFDTTDQRLSVGSNTQVLTADSTQATGLKWATPTLGDVVGPSSAVDSNFASYNTTTGKLIKDSGSKASDFAPALGVDDNYVTDAEKIVIGNTSNTNSGDNATNTQYSSLVSNVTTDLSEGTATETTVDVNSSDGTNATLVSASTTRAGLLTKAKFDEIVANTSKISFDSTSSTRLANTSGNNTGDQDISSLVTGPTTVVDGNIAVYDSTTGKLIKDGGSKISDLGDIVGPASSTDNALARFDSTTGKLLQNGTVTEDDNGNLSSVKSIGLTPQTAPAHQEGLLFYDSVKKSYSGYVDEADITLNIGEEQWIRVINNTGSTIPNGSMVYCNGSGGGYPQIVLAEANSSDTSDVVCGMSTHDIEDGAVGYITTNGVVNLLDTSSYSAGEPLYLSDSVAGGITNAKPSYPSFLIRIGSVLISDATVGSILIKIKGMASDISINSYNGSILETISFTVDSNGTTITGSLEREGTGDLTLMLSDGFTVIDTTPPITVILTAGTDTVPVLNYVYIPLSTKTLTANTTGFPTTEYCPIGTILCQSAISLQTYKAYKVHLWTDHIAKVGDNGHINHLNHWIREQNATWQEGTALTPTITTNPASMDNVDISIASGRVLQLHDHTFPAINTVTGYAYIVNKLSANYTRIQDLNLANQDSAGNVITNGKYIQLVVWGVISEATTDCKIFINLPSALNGNVSNAIADSTKKAIYTIPKSFKGTGFLIARLVFKYTTAASGTWELITQQDLRGLVPSTTAGGTTAQSTIFTDSAFQITDDLDVSKSFQFQASGITTGTNRTITIPDANITLSGPETTTTIGTLINGATSKTTPINADKVSIWDSVTGLLQAVTWTNIKATLKTYFDTLYEGVITILGSAKGGTGNGFTKFTGPTTAEKTFTLPDASSTLLYDGGALGTPASGTLTNATGLPLTGLVDDTTTSLGVGSLELGHATDTTLSRISAGVLAVEGVVIPSISSTDTLTNKTLTDPKIITSINTQIGTTYTLVLTDASKSILANNGSSQAYTIPTNTSVAFPIGTTLIVTQYGDGIVTLTGDTGVTVNGFSAGSVATSGQYGTVALEKIGTDEWLVLGGTILESFVIAISDETTAITTGTAKVKFRIPYAFVVEEVRASLSTTSSSGLPTFDINEGGITILSTKITIDATETTSTTATTAPVISDSNLADDAEISIDCDVAGTGAKGAKVTIIGYRA